MTVSGVGGHRQEGGFPGGRGGELWVNRAEMKEKPSQLKYAEKNKEATKSIEIDEFPPLPGYSEEDESEMKVSKNENVNEEQKLEVEHSISGVCGLKAKVFNSSKCNIYYFFHPTGS